VPNILLSLTNDENDYQIEQAKQASEAARRLGVSLKIVNAGNDTISQSQQLLDAIQSKTDRPDAVIFEPVGGTGLPQVAKAAASANIGWCVLNREVEYIAEIKRQSSTAIVFSLSTNHIEVGRIMGQQLNALLPNGGEVLCIEGPTQSLASKQRSEGMMKAKLPSIHVKSLHGDWTERSGERAVQNYLSLATSRQARLDVVAAQDDAMAKGARTAFQKLGASMLNHVKFLGCDGVPATGQQWLRAGHLTATVVIPANAAQALEMMASALRTGKQPPELTYTVPSSMPDFESLRKMGRSAAFATV
jgi:ribose transport system substrate-binding protein